MLSTRGLSIRHQPQNGIVQAIEFKSDAPTSDSVADAMLSVSEVASLLNISKQSVYALIGRGALPAHRFGVRRGTIRVAIEDLNRYITACRLNARQEQCKIPRQRLKHIRLRPSGPVPTSGRETATDAGTHGPRSKDLDVP